MNFLKNPLKISELTRGTTFELDSRNHNQVEDENEMFYVDDEQADLYRNPCEMSFVEYKADMLKISEGVYKKFIKEPKADAEEIDLMRCRIVYHRSFYEEHASLPFDSTYLNGEADEICLSINGAGYLDGFLEALATMKEGEQSLFIVSYTKMYGPTGCPPRIQPKADILLDIKVLKVAIVGDAEKIEKAFKDPDACKNFVDIKESVEEARIRANDLFSQKKFESAIRMYQRILQIVSFTETHNDKEEADYKDHLIRIHTNLAICFNKKQAYQSTMSHVTQCEAMLGNIDNHPRILYAKGRALMMMSEYDKALDALTKVLKIKPMDSQVIAALEELNERKNKYKNFNDNFGKNLKLN